jgi:BR serine/threonine kinase
LNVKIADFGFARFVKSSLAETACGSPHYAAPEIIKGNPYDGKKADVWSCGVILYALLAGYLPFDDTSIRALLMKVKKGQYIMPAFSRAACDLISRMLTLDPEARITIEQIKEHDFFKGDLPVGYVLPRPLAFESINEPINVEEIPGDVLEELQKIGYLEADELARDLAEPRHTMAKVFFYMLTTRIGFERVDWTVSHSHESSIICDDAPTAFAMGGSDPFHRYVGAAPDSLSSSSTLSYAVRPAWAEMGGQREADATREIPCRGRTLVEVMMILQATMRIAGMEWLHPDDFTIVARSKGLGLYIVIQAWIGEGGAVQLAIQKYTGAEGFEAICHAVDDALGGI